MLVAEAVPVAPAAGAVVTFGAFCVVVVLWGMVYGSQHTIRPTLNAVAWLFDQIRITVFGHTISFGGWVARQIRALERKIDRDLGQAALSLEHTAGALWNTTAWLVNETGKLLALLAATTLHGFHAFRHAVLPRYVHAIARPIQQDVKALSRFAHASAATLTHDWHRLNRFAHASAATLTHATTVTLPHEIGHLGARVGDLTHSLKGVRTRLRDLEKILAGATFAALVWTALRRLGLGFLRCSKVKRLGREMCGLDPTLFESLLLDIAAVAGTMSLLEFARELQDVTAFSARAIRHFWEAE